MRISMLLGFFAVVMMPHRCLAAPLINVLEAGSRVPPMLEQRDVAVDDPLAGLNYVTDHGLIIVTGEHGNGQLMLSSTAQGETASTHEPNPQGSEGPPLTADALWHQLQAIPLGATGLIELPNGKYAATHDNNYDHGVDGRTWVGYLNGDKLNRVLVTSGEGSLTGTIFTPTDRYSVDNNRIVDLNKYERLPFEDHLPPSERTARAAKQSAALPEAQASSAAGPAVIDVFVFFDPELNHGRPRVRIRHMVAVANQALTDSKIQAQVRLAGMRRLNWLAAPETKLLDNDPILERFRSLLATDPNYKAYRDNVGADLVSVVRSNRSAQQSCGLGYIGGAEGQGFRKRSGLSVVSDGLDELQMTSCDDYTFVHELGHNLGSSHDRENAPYPGHFAYSYGYRDTDAYGREWYTIMAYGQSYSARLVPRFSSPERLCAGGQGGEVACGTADDDNIKSLQNCVAAVAAYRKPKP